MTTPTEIVNWTPNDSVPGPPDWYQGPQGPAGPMGGTGPPGPQGETGPEGSVSAASAGSAATPSISFAADLNTGLYNPAPDTIGFSAGGTQKMVVDANGVTAIGLLDKGGQVFNVKAYGAVGNGVADDTAAIQAAQTAASAVGGLVAVPHGLYLTTLAGNQLVGPIKGHGQIITTDGGNHKRGSWFSAATAPPAVRSAGGGVVTDFDGDISKSQLQIEHRVTGATTLGQPTSGYLDNAEVAPVFISLFTDSGHNQATNANVGRTQLAGIYVHVANYGNGDVTCFNGAAFVQGAKAGATSFLANPAALLYNGSVFAGANGVYLNPFELSLKDQGYDVAGIGAVFSLNRTVSTGALDALWGGVRVQTGGTQPVDTGLMVINGATGGFRVGVDLAAAGLTTSGTWINAAVTLSQDQRIYLQASPTDAGSSIYRRPSSTGTTWLAYNSSLTALQFVVGGNSVAQLQNNLVTFPQNVAFGAGTPALPSITFTGDLNTGLYNSAADQVGIAVGGHDQLFITTNLVEQRNGTNAQILLVYGTYANNGVDYERLMIQTQAGAASQIILQQAGTGVARPLRIGTTGGSAVIIRMNNTDYWQFFSTGHLIAQTENTVDIGIAASNRPRNIFAVGALATGVKAGAAVDGDVNTPTDGMLRLDTTNHRLYVRDSGTWRYAALT